MSKASGFHISLSGGKNSCSVALIVYNLCCLVYNHIANKGYEDTILKDLRKIVNNPTYKPTSPKNICSKLLFTTYMVTENSNRNNQERAA
jgi:NAD+ synthase (glutamine-hydrolysing)